MSISVFPAFGRYAHGEQPGHLKCHLKYNGNGRNELDIDCEMCSSIIGITLGSGGRETGLSLTDYNGDSAHCSGETFTRPGRPLTLERPAEMFGKQIIKEKVEDPIRSIAIVALAALCLSVVALFIASGACHGN